MHVFYCSHSFTNDSGRDIINSSGLYHTTPAFWATDCTGRIQELAGAIATGSRIWFGCHLECSLRHGIFTAALLLYLHTHQSLNYLNSPRANPTYLLPLLPLRPPPNGARPLYSQPPPLNLRTRNTSRTPRHSHPENHAPYIRPGSREKRAKVQQDGWRGRSAEQLGLYQQHQEMERSGVEFMDNRLLNWFQDLAHGDNIRMAL